MGFSFSLLLIAVGAILGFAVNVDSPGFNLNAIGYILLGVGVLGTMLSIAFWSSWGGFGSARGSNSSTTIIEH